MSAPTVLVIDDEEDILELIRFTLTREGFSVSCASSGEAGLKLAESDPFSVILLDLMLPGVDGLDLCKILRASPRTKETPIVMITAKGEETDVVSGIETGADDYVTKPFSPRVLVARVKAVLRRTRTAVPDVSEVISCDGITIDPKRHEVLIDGLRIDLAATEFRILHLLARHRGTVFPRHRIVDLVHGTDYPVTDRSIDVQMVSLRKKLGSHGALIETVRGVGYRCKDPET